MAPPNQSAEALDAVRPARREDRLRTRIRSGFAPLDYSWLVQRWFRTRRPEGSSSSSMATRTCGARSLILPTLGARSPAAVEAARSATSRLRREACACVRVAVVGQGREAVRHRAAKKQHDEAIAFSLSNRSLDLAPPVGAAVAGLGPHKRHQTTGGGRERGMVDATGEGQAVDALVLGPLLAGGRWSPPARRCTPAFARLRRCRLARPPAAFYAPSGGRVAGIACGCRSSRCRGRRARADGARLGNLVGQRCDIRCARR